MTVFAEKKQLVAPGEALAEGSYFPGENTYREGNKVYATRIGLAELVANKLIVVPLKGCYIPRVDDFVIGRVVDMAMSGWTMDITSPYPAYLPLSETPAARGMAVRKDLAKILNVGDLVMAEVIAFDRTRDPLLTIRGRGLGKVDSGRIVRISRREDTQTHWKKRIDDKPPEEGDKLRNDRRSERNGTNHRSAAQERTSCSSGNIHDRTRSTHPRTHGPRKRNDDQRIEVERDEQTRDQTC